MSTNDELLRFAKRLIGDETAAGDARLEEIESRLMPEGYSWPREADGTPVIPDENVEFPVRDASPYTMKVDAVAFGADHVELHDETRTFPIKRSMGETVNPELLPALDGEGSPSLLDSAGEDKVINWDALADRLEKILDPFGYFACCRANIEEAVGAHDDMLCELEERLMPEGMSWPRDGNGAYIVPGDYVVNEFEGRTYAMKVDAVAFTKNGCELHDETRTLPVEYGYGEAVERAAPDMSNVELTMEETNLSRSVDPAQQSAEQGFGQTQRTMSWSRYEA